MNTWGFGSINCTTLNYEKSSDWSYYDKKIRDGDLRKLRVSHFILDTLGYIPVVSIVSGGLRAFIGGAILLNQGKNSEFTRECNRTAKAQIVRGFIEITCLSILINGVIGAIATISNIYHILKAKGYFTPKGDLNLSKPFHKGPCYPHVCKLLYLV